jgi:hypothetical protein
MTFRDWEGYQVRLRPGQETAARATSHGGYSSGWSPATDWYRVSGGSHAGQIAAGPSGERTTLSSELRLTPLERVPGLAGHRFEVPPPWVKDVYRDPESTSS